MRFFKPIGNKLAKAQGGSPKMEGESTTALSSLSEEDKQSVIAYIKTLIDIVKAHEAR